MEGGLGAFQFVEHLFIEFLSVPQAGVLDFHVLGPGHGNHAFGQIRNLDRLAHVEDEDFSAVALGSGFQHQLAGFRDEHEETHDALVRDGDRTAAADLLLEERNDGTVGTQHVAKAGGDKLGALRELAVAALGGLHGFQLELAVQALDVDFADTLAASHDVGGIHRLVRGYHHELLGAVLHGHIGNDLGAVDVVHDRLGGVVLHHGHMLVRRGMENIVRTEGAEHAFHARTAADAGDHHLAGDVREIPGHHEADIVLRGFRLVDEHHFGGLEAGHLAHDFHADGAGRTGDEDPFAGKLFLHRLQVHADFRAGQQVLYAHLFELDIVVLDFSVFYAGFRGLVGHVNFYAVGNADILHFLVVPELVHPERAHQHGLNAFLPDDGSQVIVLGIYRDTQQFHVLDAVLMGDETADLELARALRTHALGQGHTAGDGAVNEGALGLGILVDAVE